MLLVDWINWNCCDSLRLTFSVWRQNQVVTQNSKQRGIFRKSVLPLQLQQTCSPDTDQILCRNILHCWHQRRHQQPLLARLWNPELENFTHQKKNIKTGSQKHLLIPRFALTYLGSCSKLKALPFTVLWTYLKARSLIWVLARHNRSYSRNTCCTMFHCFS